MTPELDILIKATTVLMIGLAATALAARARASVRHVLLAATLGALIALPLAAFLTPDLVVAIQLPRVASSLGAPEGGALAPGRAPAGAAGLASSAAASLGDARDAWPASIGMSASTALQLIWAAGAVLLLVWLANGLRRVRAIRRGGLPWLAGQTAAETLARESGIGRPLSVVLHEDVPAPVTCGWRSPTIVLPTDARDWSESDLRRAFVHELEHIRRADWPMQLAARAVCAAYWFHPLVWVAWRRLGLESERACDDAVVDRAEQADYAEQLVTLAERLAHGHRQPVLSMANRSDLSVRVRAVLDRTQLRGRAGASLAAATIAAAGIVVLVLATVRVEALPDQGANSAGSQRAFADGNRRVSAATRALNEAIVDAAQKGDIDEVIELLDDGGNVNAVVPGDGTPLLVAARRGHLDVVRLLLDRGADPDIGVHGDGNALTMAARGGYRDIVTMLLERGADVNAGVEGDGNALIMAARAGHAGIVTMLLDRGALIEEVVPGDENALISASGAGRLDVVRLLVSRGANVNARVWAEQGWPTRQGEWRTPLNQALRGGHAAVADYLRSVGAVE